MNGENRHSEIAKHKATHPFYHHQQHDVFSYDLFICFKRGLSFRFICFFTAAILSSMPISPSRQRKFGGHATIMSAVAAAVPKAGAKIQNKINIPKKKIKKPCGNPYRRAIINL
ncbi:MAG: hypothetical protein K5864_09920 [Bacteroidales bacterium]|nr:hypothetical protein [Bacteroidales bacterium]